MLESFLQSGTTFGLTPYKPQI
uniref:Uncharacterized protein n=1 Tax=Physcomitrium patens TaxID=3218 RepID=A0A2K1KJR0_PHYPA|nr:hypothetical protein PHYPA_007685 [Physcomitrium patens]